jgi:hypothetical protein
VKRPNPLQQQQQEFLFKPPKSLNLANFFALFTFDAISRRKFKNLSHKDAASHP